MSERAREKLICAFRMTAKEEGLCPARTDRYQAWAFAFLCWCLGSPPRPVDCSQIEPFRRALRRTDTDEVKVQEAMDALAFLFGAVGASEILSLDLPEALRSCADPSAGESKRKDGRRERPQTVDVGWHDRERVFNAVPSGKALWEWMDASTNATGTEGACEERTDV